MDAERFAFTLKVGETNAVEFKRCGNGIEADTYQTVCSFLNRFGGDIYLGVLDDGTPVGVPPKAAPTLVKNFINCIGNPDLFSPTIYVEPRIFEYEGKTFIHIHLAASAEVHSYKRVIYDRAGDADIRVTATAQIAQMYIRKQNIFTEMRIYPHVSLADLRTDMFPLLRTMAANTSGGGTHPWHSMNDEELLRGAGLIGVDRQTGESGLNLAAVLLLGRDEVIKDVAPAYETDCILRRNNTDRYDDRLVVATNLIESYGQITDFARKHLPDMFFLEGDRRISLLGVISREMVSNLLIHREFSSQYVAKLVVGRDRLYCENANRAVGAGLITPENLQPTPKNPIIANFFRNIGLADKLGSGVRNLYKYAANYYGGAPRFEEGDLFRIVVDFTTPPTDADLEHAKRERETVKRENETVNMENETVNSKSETVKRENETVNSESETVTGKNRFVNGGNRFVNDENRFVNDLESRLIELLKEKPESTYADLSAALGVNRSKVARLLKSLSSRGLITRIGADKKGRWVVNGRVFDCRGCRDNDEGV